MAYLYVLVVCVCVLFCEVLCQFNQWNQGFYQPQREDRRYERPFQFAQNFFPDPRRVTNRLSTILSFKTEDSYNKDFIYPFNGQATVSNNGPSYDQYGRPIYNQNYEEYTPNRNQYNTQMYQNYNVNNAGTNQEYYDSTKLNQADKDSINNYEIKAEQYDAVSYNTDMADNNKYSATFPQSSNQFNQDNSNAKAAATFNYEANDNQNEKPTSIKTNVESKPFVFPDQETPVTETKQTEDNTQGFAIAPPAVPETFTTLPTLTPVPKSESRSNFNFGSAGLFQETCDTAEGDVGTCLSVFQCAPYLKILHTSASNPSTVQLLRKAHCGFEGNNPKVCCPKPNIPTAPPPQQRTTTTTQAPIVPDEMNNEADGQFLDAFPEPPVCGVSNASFSRVVGGIAAKLGDFPWMALLGYQGRRNPGTRWLCGGSLITARHVLTAAHCIHGRENELYVVRLGELDLADENEGATPLDVLIKSKIKHEDYSSKAFTNDIGLLLLEKQISFTGLIKPICIPMNSELRAKSFENYNPIIAGWGDTEFHGPAATHLQALQLPVVSNSFCAQAYSAYKAQKIDERVLCAGYKKGGKDACQGDSGGPLMQPIWNSQNFTTYFYQIGVVSYGKRCAEAGFPGVYTRVTHFVPWLQEKILGASNL